MCSFDSQYSYLSSLSYIYSQCSTVPTAELLFPFFQQKNMFGFLLLFKTMGKSVLFVANLKLSHNTPLFYPAGIAASEVP